MTRKYISEFGLSMRADRLLILQQRHLHLVTEEALGPGKTCHIYVIGRRPRIAFDPASFKVTPEAIQAAFVVHRRDGAAIYDFELQNRPTDPVVKIECEYPYSDFSFRNAKGESTVDGPVAQYLPTIGVHELHPDVFDLEVLYVGQAFGKGGTRSAPQRLTNHETFQRIYAEANHETPEMEIWIVLFSFRPWILASFDGRTNTFDTTLAEDTTHLEKVAHTDVTEGQRIAYTEAAMIRYFQPQYNIQYKDNFPDLKHTSYHECYDLDLNSVYVELDSHEIGCRLWSPAVPPAWEHMISYALHSPEERQHMFDLSPGVIPKPDAQGH